jgi:hypothetical protein
MPSRQVCQLLGDADLRDAADPKGADSGDIGDGEGVTSYASAARQLTVEPGHFFLGVASADVTVGKDLLNAPFPMRRQWRKAPVMLPISSKYRQIAVDSARQVPSSNSNTGTRASGFLATKSAE